jgi:alkylation response protein AidB-like acyl-CoA dehydrogenase
VTTEIALPTTTAAGVFTAEQENLRESARRFLDDRCPPAVVRALMETPAGFDENVWKEMANLGWMGIAIPEAYGGAGYGSFELAVLLEEMGRVLLPAPFFSSVVESASAVLYAGGEDQKKRLLPRIASGENRAALAFTEKGGRWDPDSVRMTATRTGDGYRLTGAKWFVVDGASADLLVVAARIEGSTVALFLVDPAAPGIARTPMQTLDLTRKQAMIEFAGVEAELLGDASSDVDALPRILQLATVGLAAEMVGGAQRCLGRSDHSKRSSTSAPTC